MSSADSEFIPYRKLACAIIKYSARDYKRALKKLTKDPLDERALEMKMENEIFFNSTWYSQLTNISKDYLMNHIRKEVGYVD